MKPPPHPMQPIVRDQEGILRFRSNPIVVFLLDAGPHDMNALRRMPFTDEDRAHFAQLIGYSVGGYGDLSYVTGDQWAEADAAADLLRPGASAT